MADRASQTATSTLIAGARDDPYGAGLVLGQLLAGAGLLWPGPARWSLPALVRGAALTATGAGAGVAITAFANLGPDMSPLPSPAEGARLHRDGAYAVARHPIYAGLLLGGLGFAVLRRRPEPLVAEVVLAAVLHAKSRHEDRMLRRRFGAEWDAYAAEVPALVPRWPSSRPAAAPS